MTRHPRYFALLAASALVVATLGSAGSALAETVPVPPAPPVLQTLQASTTGDVTPGQTVDETFTATADPGSVITFERIVLVDSVGKVHVFGEITTPGTVVVHVDKTWAPGPVSVRWIVVDADSSQTGTESFAAYYGNGDFASSPQLSQKPPAFDFTPAVFTVVNPDANVTPPIVTAIHSSSTPPVGPGDQVAESITIVDADTVTGSVLITDAGGVAHQAAVGQPVDIDPTWHDGPARVTEIDLKDTSGNSAVYRDTGLLSTIPTSASTSQTVDFSGGDFVVQAQTLTHETTPVVIGVATVGTMLTVDPGDWEPAPVSFSCQWYVNGFPYDAPSPTFVIPSDAWHKRITVQVTGSATGYRPVSLMSAATHTVAQPMTAAPIPVVRGLPQVGKPLTAVLGTWGPAPVTLSRQWLVDGVPVAHATRSTFVPTQADKGKKITVRVTGTRLGYAVTVRTNVATRVVAGK
jgi:hypothetical protein